MAFYGYKNVFLPRYLPYSEPEHIYWLKFRSRKRKEGKSHRVVLLLSQHGCSGKQCRARGMLLVPLPVFCHASLTSR